MLPNKCPPELSLLLCLQIGFPRDLDPYKVYSVRGNQYSEKIIVEQTNDVSSFRNDLQRWVSSAARKTVKIRWIIHRVDRRWTRELTSSLEAQDRISTLMRIEEKMKKRWGRKDDVERRRRERARFRVRVISQSAHTFALRSSSVFFTFLSLFRSLSRSLFLTRAIPDR